MSENLKWYSLRVISGKEKSIRNRIDAEVKLCGWTEIVPQVVVPMERVFKIRNGKKTVQERNILPGYILVQADSTRISGDIAHQLAQLPNVIHFLGKDNPLPMHQAEANRLLGVHDDSGEALDQALEPFTVGEQINITDGPFTGFVGEIASINDERRRLKVTVKIFGRPTEVELSFLQVEKAD
jgi:transcriptional antiterminator NusG